MATATRTDIHRPSAPEFDPEAYVCLGVWDLHTKSAHRVRVINDQLAQGHRIAPHANGCGHCGANIRYGALLLHTGGELIYVGEECLANRFESLTKAEFQSLRKAAKLNAERTRLADKVVAFFEANPALVELTYLANADWLAFEFTHSLASQVQRNGALSERQIAAAERVLGNAHERQAAWEAKKAAEAAQEATEAREQAPEGRVVVTGAVLSTRWVENAYGASLKGWVRDDRGFKVWTTIPAAVLDDNAIADDVRISFTATLTAADDDAYKAFGNRPAKARRV